MIHVWILGDAWNHRKLPKHARRLKIFVSALMMGFLPKLCHIECKWDSLNSTNNPQKSKFQDKGGEEINKVKENIFENLAGNKTAVKIRVRNGTIKEGRETKERGILDKRWKGNNLKEIYRESVCNTAETKEFLVVISE